MNKLWRKLTGHCLPFFHRYRIDLDATDEFNRNCGLSLFGSKVYFCDDCGRGYLRWPPGVC